MKVNANFSLMLLVVHAVCLITVFIPAYLLLSSIYSVPTSIIVSMAIFMAVSQVGFRLLRNR